MTRDVPDPFPLGVVQRSNHAITPKTSRESKVEPIRPETEAPPANGWTQKFFVHRDNTTPGKFAN